MSRYDGLIIPRSYNEYINKTDPVAMSQALQLNNVLAQEVAAGNNKAVTSNAVNGALTNYQKFIDVGINQKTIETLYAEQANQTVVNYWGQFTDSGASYSTGYVTINKTSNAYGNAIFISDAGQFYRALLNGVWQDWQQLALKSDLANYIKKKDFLGSNTYNFFNFRVYCDIGQFYGLLLLEKDNNFGLFFANFQEGQWNLINKLGGNLEVNGVNNQGTIAFVQEVTGYNYRLISIA